MDDVNAIMGRIAIRVIPWVSSLALTVTALLGIAIIFAVGFASPEVIHNAAHDVRHGINFICH